MRREVYLGLGGNVGDSLAILQSALRNIEQLAIKDFKASRFYRTKPVSEIEQSWFVNAVCRFNTMMDARELLYKLQQIEATHGKVPKPKNAPRPIDIDLLFYGNERHNSVDCEIPHPRWKERLFVIKPLSDLTSSIVIPGVNEGDKGVLVDLMELIRTFPDQTSCELLKTQLATYDASHSKLFSLWEFAKVNSNI